MQPWQTHLVLALRTYLALLPVISTQQRLESTVINNEEEKKKCWEGRGDIKACSHGHPALVCIWCCTEHSCSPQPSHQHSQTAASRLSTPTAASPDSLRSTSPHPMLPGVPEGRTQLHLPVPPPWCSPVLTLATHLFHSLLLERRRGQ